MNNQESKQTKSIRLAEKLERFSILPDDALVSIDVVCALYDRSKASVERDAKAGMCPSPLRVGNRSKRWRVGDLRKAFEIVASKKAEAFYG